MLKISVAKRVLLASGVVGLLCATPAQAQLEQALAPGTTVNVRCRDGRPYAAAATVVAAATAAAGTLRVCRQNFSLKDAIAFHAFVPLEARACV